MYTGMHSHVCDTVTSFCHGDVQHKENRPTKGTIYQISNLTESFISLFRVLFWGYFSFSLINVKVNDPRQQRDGETSTLLHGLSSDPKAQTLDSISDKKNRDLLLFLGNHAEQSIPSVTLRSQEAYYFPQYGATGQC